MSLQQSSIPHKETDYPHYYLCNYLPVSVGQDALSQSLLKFKRGRQPDLNGWIGCALEILEKAFVYRDSPSSPDSSFFSPDSPPIGADSIAIPAGSVVVPPPNPTNPLPASIIPFPPDSIFIRALHHDETSVHEDSPGSLDKLGKALAARFQGHYRPRLLRKSLPTREIKGLSKEQRMAELRDLYYIDSAYYIDTAGSPASLLPVAENLWLPPTPSFVIVDDILTTGATMKMIVGAVLQTYPSARLTIFTLAKADYNNSLNQSAPLQGRDYPPGHGVEEIVAEESDGIYSLHVLKTRIRSDSWL